MKLRFTHLATQDIAGIADYIATEDPSAAAHVRDDILAALQLLADFPAIGRRQDIEAVRKLVTRKYRYVAYYLTDEAHDEIVVLTIRHPARERNFSDE
jgi:toxin ParE1/3/4